MKNVYIIDEHTSSKVNGIGPFIKSYVACLKKMDVTISIISFNEELNEFDIRVERGIKKFLFPVFPTDNFPIYYQVINRFLKQYIEDSIENVFCFNHAPCKDLFQTVRDSFPLSKLVFTIHDMGWTLELNGDAGMLEHIVFQRKKKRVYQKYGYLLNFFDQEIQTYNIADAVVCLCQSTHDVLKDVYKVPVDKIYLLPSGMKKKTFFMTGEEKIRFRREMNIRDQERIILYVGRLSEPKGVYPLVTAFSKILKTWPDARLVLAGSANDEWNNFFARVKNISSKITVTGFIPKKELKKWYQIADMGIIPSYYEQCPYVGIEMMMYHLALVVSDGNGLRDMFQDGINAKVARIGNRQNEEEFSHNIYCALEELLTSGQLRMELGEKARQTFLSIYSLVPMFRRYQCFLFQTQNLNITQSGC